MGNRELIREFALDEHIVCPLCQDYFSDAVTLNSCLHSFCRKCLQKCLNFSPTNSSSAVYKCPKCFVDLGAEPAYRRDPKLQEMTYKLVPDLLWRQIRKAARRRHRHHSSGDSTQLSERRIEQRKQLIQISTQLCSANEKISIQIDFVPLSAVLAANDEKEEAQNKEMPLPQEANAKHSFRRFLRCSSKVRIEQLKKLLELKLAMTESYGVYFIDPTLRDVLEDEYSLEDLIEMFHWSRDAPFQLRFTLARIPVEEEEDHPPILEEMPQLDVESGPMERPIHQDQSPREEAQKIDDVPLRNKKKDDKKEATLAAGSKKDEVPSTSGSSSHFQTRHKVPSSSPPANFSSMPRLSTAGVSPLRPVPSHGNFGAVPSTNHQQQQTTTAASKKRKRNSATAAAGEKAKMVQQGPSSSAQKMLKFGSDLKTKDAENDAKTMMISPLASSFQNEAEPKGGEMNKESVKKEEKEEPQFKGPVISSTVANEPTSIPSSSSGQEPPSSIQIPQPFVQKTPKEKKKRQPANPKPKQNSANKKTQPKMPSSIPSFTLGSIGPQSSSSAAQQSNQLMGSATASGPSTTPPILISPQQFGQMPIIQMQNQQQQQYAAAQFMQSLLQQNRQANDAFGALAGMFQGLSPQQVQAMQQMIGGMANLAAMANGVVQQQSHGPQQKMAYNKVPAAKQQSNGRIGTSKLGSNLNGAKSASHKAKTSPQKTTTLPTMAPTSSAVKSNNQQLFASSSQHAQSGTTHLKSNPHQSAQKIIVSSSSINSNILNPNPLLTTTTLR